MKMNKKIIVPVILAVGMQLPLIAMDSDPSSDNQTQATSLTKIGLGAAGVGFGGYGLYKAYKWATYKNPVPPTFFEKLAAQLPGGDTVLEVAQKGVRYAQENKYITSAAALAAVGWLGYKYGIEPGIQAERAKELKYYIEGICKHSFALQGGTIALKQACKYVQSLAGQFEDKALMEGVCDLVNYCFGKDDVRVVRAAEWAKEHSDAQEGQMPDHIKNGMLAFDRELKAKGVALFEKIDEIVSPA